MAGGPTAIDIAREVFPDLPNDELTPILWEHTGYPHWWAIREGETIEDCLRRQLNQFKDGDCDCPGCEIAKV